MVDVAKANPWQIDAKYSQSKTQGEQWRSFWPCRESKCSSNACVRAPMRTRYAPKKADKTASSNNLLCESWYNARPNQTNTARAANRLLGSQRPYGKRECAALAYTAVCYHINSPLTCRGSNIETRESTLWVLPGLSSPVCLWRTLPPTPFPASLSPHASTPSG